MVTCNTGVKKYGEGWINQEDSPSSGFDPTACLCYATFPTLLLKWIVQKAFHAFNNYPYSFLGLFGFCFSFLFFFLFFSSFFIKQSPVWMSRHGGSRCAVNVVLECFNYFFKSPLFQERPQIIFLFWQHLIGEHIIKKWWYRTKYNNILFPSYKWYLFSPVGPDTYGCVFE